MTSTHLTAGFSWKASASATAHAGKMMLIDGKKAVVGSLALAAISIDFRREVSLVVEDPGGVAALEALFRSIAASPSTVPAASAGGI